MQWIVVVMDEAYGPFDSEAEAQAFADTHAGQVAILTPPDEAP